MGVREWRDIRRSEIAEAGGVDPSTITLYEQGKSNVGEDALAKLAAYLGVTPAYLRYGVTEPAVLDLSRAKRLSEAQLDRADAITARAAKSEPKAKNARKKGGAA